MRPTLCGVNLVTTECKESRNAGKSWVSWLILSKITKEEIGMSEQWEVVSWIRFNHNPDDNCKQERLYRPIDVTAIEELTKRRRFLDDNSGSTASLLCIALKLTPIKQEKNSNKYKTKKKVVKTMELACWLSEWYHSNISENCNCTSHADCHNGKCQCAKGYEMNEEGHCVQRK